MSLTIVGLNAVIVPTVNILRLYENPKYYIEKMHTVFPMLYKPIFAQQQQKLNVKIINMKHMC